MDWTGSLSGIACVIAAVVVCGSARPAEPPHLQAGESLWKHDADQRALTGRNLIADAEYQYSVRRRDSSIREYLFEGDIQGVEKLPSSNNAEDSWDFSGLGSGQNNDKPPRFWEDRIIPCTIEPRSFKQSDIDLIEQALRGIESNTCLTFPRRTHQHNYIIFVLGNNGCSSWVGQNAGEQAIYLDPSCLNLVGEIQHQIMHAIGFWHEQSRMDRDQYVKIIWPNIAQGLSQQFQKYNVPTFGLPYDYSSIMHYAHNTFSSDPDDRPTILPISQAPFTHRPEKRRMGNRIELSPGDINRINYMYSCPQSLPSVSKNRGTETTEWMPTPTPDLSTLDSTPLSQETLSNSSSTYNTAPRHVPGTGRPGGITVTMEQAAADFFCYFYTNQTYSCKTDCEPSGGELKLGNFNSNSNMKFYDMNCKTNVQIPFGKRWEIGSRAIVRGVTNTAHDTEIITTCAFYNSMDFDCNGVTDCKEANNENRCGSAAPWSGRYSGSPDQGFKLNGTITKTGSDAGSG